MIKILYLEDNKFDIDLTRIEFRNAFPESVIDITNTIESATKFLKKGTKYDVALLDLNLPDGNGIDILMYIRKHNLPIAVVILTGSGNEESAIAALKAGADDYITKKQGYHKKLPDILNGAIENYKQNLEKRTRQLRVLYVEWNKPDVDFTIRHMQKYAPHIHFETVMQAEEALNKLPKNSNENCAYDVLLLDYHLPGLNALDTIKIIRQERKLSISIVLVTGHGNEDVAVQALKLGADEYLVKRENYLFRLPSLLTSAFNRYELERQQKTLRESEAKYRLLAENSGDVIFILNLEFKYIYVSPSVKELRGFEVEEVLKQDLSQVLTPGSYRVIEQLISQIKPFLNYRQFKEIKPQVLELEMIKKDGTTVWTEVKVAVLADENGIPIGVQGSARDISKRKEAIEELLNSREEYRSFFEDDLTGDFISTVDGKLLNCNPAYLNMLGFKSKEQALNYDLTKLRLNKNDRNEMLDALKKNKRLINYEHDLIRIDGKIIHAIANIIGQFDKNGNLLSLKEYIFDDTERKKAIAELRKLSTAIEQSPASVIITDTRGNIEYVNPKFTEVTGYTFEEVLGKNPRILKSGNLSDEEYSTLWKTIKLGKTWTGEFQNRKKDGTLFWESASISPIKIESGIPTHFLAVKEDISAKKKYEEELIIARDQAQESDRLKSAFLATMSHELRTPLNAIIGFSDLIDDDMSKADIIRFAKTINNSGNHLLSIIEDIFTVSLLQTKQSKVITEEFKISDFFKAIIQYANVELETKNKTSLHIKYDQEVFASKSRINSDKTKIFQVLLNFIKNAVEFTEKGEIEIGHSISKNDVTFFVKDTGIGIPSNKIDFIFEQFRQLDDTHTRVHDGIGLGLSICSEIQKLLNGKIWVESEVGLGSVFYFSLPNVVIGEKEETELVSLKPEIPDLKNKTILIVEDEVTNYMLLETYMKRTNATVIWAKSGEESIEICKSNPNIDLVFMDIRMPGIDGIEAANQIKMFLPQLKIIAQTAFAFEHDRENILNSSCDGYISKPIDLKKLMDLLNKHFKPDVY